MEKFPVLRSGTNYSDNDLIDKYKLSVKNFKLALNEKENINSSCDYLAKYIAYLKFRFAKEEKETLFYDMRLRKLIT